VFGDFNHILYRVDEPCEAWVAADPFPGDVRVIIIGPQGFERQVAFAMNQDGPEIARRVPETIKEET
jgi:hypothetical protein